MRYRKLTTDGDYSFGNSQLDFYRNDPQGVGQAVKTRLLLWLGEWFLNIDEGTPYLLGILGKHSQATADATIQDRITSTEGVVDIEEYESIIDSENRIMQVITTINTEFGPTNVEVQNYRNY